MTDKKVATASPEGESWVTKVVRKNKVSIKVRHDYRKGFDKFVSEYTNKKYLNFVKSKKDFYLCEFKFLGVDFINNQQLPLEAFVYTYLMKVQKKLYADYQIALEDFYIEKKKLYPYDHEMALEFYLEHHGLTDKLSESSNKDFPDQLGFSHWCGIDRDHFGKHDGHRAYGKGGFHASGAAIDINYYKSPYICVRNGKHYGGCKEKIPADVLRVAIDKTSAPFNIYKNSTNSELKDWLDGKTSFDDLVNADDKKKINSDLKASGINKKIINQYIYKPATEAIDRASIFFDGVPADLSTDKTFLLFKDWPDTENKAALNAYKEHISSLYDQFEKVHNCWVEYFTLGCDPNTEKGKPDTGSDFFISQFEKKWNNGAIKPACIKLIFQEFKEDYMSLKTLTELFTVPSALNMKDKVVKTALDRYYRRRFKQDYNDILPIIVIKNNHFSVDSNNIKITTPVYRNPAWGFLNIPKHVVMALTIEGGLSWGGTMWGQTTSGDMMHFDMRTGVKQIKK